MTREAKDQPASLLDIANFVTSPWVLLTLVVSIVFLSIVVRAEGEAVYAMTPPWFVPYGAVAGIIGLLATGLAVRSAVHFVGLAVLAFAPGVLFMLFNSAIAPLTDSSKTMFGIFFIVAPWVTLVAALFERKADRRGSAK